MKAKVPLFDSLGRPIWFDREEFRNHVIPENLKAEWDNPQELYEFVVQIFRDGFIEEAEKGADRLLELYRRDEGTLVLKAAVLLRKGDDAGRKSCCWNASENTLSGELPTRFSPGCIPAAGTGRGPFPR